ncbi:MAG: acetyltransferase [Betaproteobacteria bacterium]
MQRRTELDEFAERIRDTLLAAALQAYEDAGVQGLCAEGRWEAAVGAVRAVDVGSLASAGSSRVDMAGNE